MQFLELFNVKYFGMISNGETKHKSNHLKTNLSVDLHLKLLLLGNWQEKDTFSCITKALLISVLSPLWGLLILNSGKNWLLLFVRQQS